MSLITRIITQKLIEVWLYNKCHKIYLIDPFGIFFLRHPNLLLLAGANNRNVIITQPFHAAIVNKNKNNS